jgi:predicted Zn-dependent protease
MHGVTGRQGRLKMFHRGAFARAVAVATALATAMAPGLAQAQRAAAAPALVRDVEIETLLQDYTAPLFRAAGLGKGAVDVYLVNNNSFNAFVSGRRMFVHTGAIVTSESPNELIGVLAHETGHIIGGHNARLRDRVDKAGILAALSILAGAGAIAFGGEAGRNAGPALALGGQSAILRDFLAYKRSEEAAADNSAVTLLNATKQSSAGMLRTFERFSQNLLFSGDRVNPYMQSHPMPNERIALLEDIARKSPYFDQKDPAALQLRHDMARAKIVAYSGNGGQLQSVFRNDPQGAAARYGLAIALFLRGSNSEALPIIDRLISEQPKNPYLHEMRGEMLLRGGNPREAAASFRRAIELDRTKSGLLRVMHGHALLETGDRASLDKALIEIKAGIGRDPTSPRGFGLLARAYGMTGQPDLARAAAAEEAFYTFRFKEAARLAKLAQPKLKTGTPEWLRMQDIIDYKPPKS